MSLRRIEGSGVDPTLQEGLASPVADPLWFLARQWQTGEFRGEDAASPIIVEADIDHYPITQVMIPGASEEIDFQPGGTPIETLAEREARPTDDFARAEAGLALYRRLRKANLSGDARAAFREVYPLKVKRPQDAGGPAGPAQLAQIAAGSFDAVALMREIVKVEQNMGKLSVMEKIDGNETAQVIATLGDWYTAEAALLSVPEDQAHAWQDRSQQYRFKIQAETEKGPIRMEAPAYPGGRLDWYDFDIVSQPEELPEANRQTVRVLASPLRFAGQPASRWWEMEEGDTYFGDLAGGPDDLARSVLAAYATVAGDDWFVIPVRLPSGALARVAELRVYDNFLEGPVTLRSAAEKDAETGDKTRPWRWFEPSLGGEAKPAAGAPLLLLIPATNTTEQARPLERVEFRRDEMANLAWAIEQVVPGSLGRGLNSPAAPPSRVPETEQGVWRFELGTQIPRHWYPMVPVRIDGSDPSVALRRGVLAQDPDAAPQEPPQGAILLPGQPFYFDEAELPEGGLKVVRRYQMTRSADGGAHFWLGRRKRPSDGPMERTRLEFDRLSGFPKDRKG